MIKINSKNYENKEVIKIEINGKVYSMPLMKYLKYKEIKKLMKLQNTNEDFEILFEVIANYIPRDVLEELSIQQIGQIMNEWKNAETNEDGEDVNLGN